MIFIFTIWITKEETNISELQNLYVTRLLIIHFLGQGAVLVVFSIKILVMIINVITYNVSIILHALKEKKIDHVL